MYRKCADRTYEAVKQWLNKRLDLEINEDKSQVIDIRKKSSEFLRLRFKAKNKGDKTVVYSHISDKAKEKTIVNLKNSINLIKDKPTMQSVSNYNAVVMGIQNYFDMATHVNLDLSEIDWTIHAFRYNRLKGIMTESGNTSKTYNERFKGYNFKKQFVADLCLFPIPAVKHKKPFGFSKEICDYTEEGRNKIHSNLKIDVNMIHYIMENPPPNCSIELADNRISLYSAQWGKCGVTGEELCIGFMDVHHKLPIEFGGTDVYSNLIWLTADVHKLIHATRTDTINKYLMRINPDKSALGKINELRKSAGNCVIVQ
jgi:hypothetical protein